MSASGGDAERIAQRVARHLGFLLSRPQRRRLARVAERLDAADGAGAAAAALPGTPAFEALVAAVLVGETSWFRDARQLDAVVSVLAERPHARRRVWSAGCATGQEPYSLAIALDRAGVAHPPIVATDIDAAALAVAEAARYDAARRRGLDAAIARSAGTDDGDAWQLSPHLRDRVVLRRHDLLRDDPPEVDVIICRNVLIYLTPDAVDVALRRFATALPEDGVLVLGHAEGMLPGSTWRPVRRDDVQVHVPQVRTATEPHTDPHAEPADAVRRGGAPDRSAAPARRGPAAPTSADELRAEGEVALQRGDAATAVAALREVRYLEPDDPLAAVLLALAQHRAGMDREGARSAAVARHLLARLPASADVAGGYPAAALQALLEGLPEEGER